MRVLYLTTEFPWPARSGGPLRTLSQLKLLASLPEIDSITLVAVAEHTVPPTDCAALAAAIPKLRVVPPAFHPIHLRAFPRYVPRVLALRAIGIPYVAAKWDSPELRRELRRHLQSTDPDIVYVDHLGMARYLPLIRRERPLAWVVLDQHNVESDVFRRFADDRRGLSRLVARAEWRATARFERHALKAVDGVIAISRADAEQFRRLADVEATVVPVVVDVSRRTRQPPARAHFCYVGSLQWHPNVAGLTWFFEHVWPRIRVRMPEATMEIAGVDLRRDSAGKPLVPVTWNAPGVEIVGFLDDLEPLYARSVALLAPVVGSSGVRIKVLEGLGAGLPVVTTVDGAFGLPLTDGKEILIASDAIGFAERVDRLVHDDGLQRRLREEGYAYLEQHHSSSIAELALRSAMGIGCPETIRRAQSSVS